MSAVKVENSIQREMEKLGVQEYIHNAEYIDSARIGSFIIGVDIPQIIVINLISRTDRQNLVIQKMMEAKLPFSFYFAELNPNPVRGCLESHINVIKWAKENKCRSVCIFEDDFVIHDDLEQVPIHSNLKKWDMLYLGGLCTVMHERLPEDSNEHCWVKGVIYCDHAYIVNESIFDKIIDEGWSYTGELDRFYTTAIHESSDHASYITQHQFVTQHDGWSDIDRKVKWGGFGWPSPGEMFNVP